jgi:hypothetical protein
MSWGSLIVSGCSFGLGYFLSSLSKSNSDYGLFLIAYAALRLLLVVLSVLVLFSAHLMEDTPTSTVADVVRHLQREQFEASQVEGSTTPSLTSSSSSSTSSSLSLSSSSSSSKKYPFETKHHHNHNLKGQFVELKGLSSGTLVPCHLTNEQALFVRTRVCALSIYLYFPVQPSFLCGFQKVDEVVEKLVETTISEPAPGPPLLPPPSPFGPPVRFLLFSFAPLSFLLL